MTDFADPDVTAASSAEPVQRYRIALADLDSLVSTFTGTVIDYHMPCTAAEGRSCQILSSLSVWNEVLCQAEIELKQVPRTPGHLAVTIIDGTFVRDHSAENLHRAATLLYWLLKEHRCITEVELSCGRLNIYEGLLCAAFQQKTSVKKLNLRETGSLGPHKDICMAISSMTRLEELECDTRSQCRETFASALSILVRTTQSLKVLHIGNLPIVGKDAITFLTALSGNSTIVDISLHGVVATARRRDKSSPFREYLTNTRALRKLSVSGQCGYPTHSIREVLFGLLENKMISTAHFKDVCLCVESSRLLTKILRQQDLVFLSLEVRFENRCGLVELGNTLNSLLVAFKENETLEELTLPFNIWHLKQWENFFLALRSKRRLKKLTIKVSFTWAYYLQDLCKAVMETGVEGKVFLENMSAGDYYRGNCEILQCRAFSDIIASSLDAAGHETLQTIAQTLPTLSHITTAILNIDASYYDGALASALGNYIGSTTALRVLKLKVYAYQVAQQADNLQWTPIFEGLSKNGSIKVLDLQPLYVGNADAEMLADAVKSSRSIRRFCFRAAGNTTVFLRQFSVDIDKNYVLLDFMIPVCMEETWFRVQEVTRRNQSLVALASYFRPGFNCDKRVAAALERVEHHPALVEEVAELTAVSEGEASDAIRAAVRTFQGLHDFMRMAGVVRERVTCHPRDDGSTQLDDLNEYCWRSVRRYISLDDVRD
ncbi:NLR family CARD domain-containing protein 3-like [Dermacentor albipictus]|uniref:NLR family CARD domain-containing protein 3-like n=1 Tax=Dermacentor albipictus TaxID=60249 RepID=UPI0031FC5066